MAGTQNLVLRGNVYYLCIKINRRLYRLSTGFRKGQGELAKRRAREMETEIRKRRAGWVEKDIPEIEEWKEKWLAAYYPKSERERRAVSTFVAAHIGRQVNEIVRSDFETYFRKRETSGMKQSTMERERVSLNCMFKAAVDDGILERNPMQGIPLFDPDVRERVMTHEEEKLLLPRCLPHWRRFFRIILLTGLRRNELLMTRPIDRRDDGRMLWVRPESNKTKKGRTVPLVEEARELLAEQERARGVCEGCDDSARDARLWIASRNAAWHHLNAQQRDLKIEKEKWITVHDLRRTFATRCARQGMYPKHLQQILGHETIEVTMKYYVHLEDVDLVDALSAIKL